MARAARSLSGRLTRADHPVYSEGSLASPCVVTHPVSHPESLRALTVTFIAMTTAAPVHCVCVCVCVGGWVFGLLLFLFV